MKNLNLLFYNPETRNLDISGDNKDIVTIGFDSVIFAELDSNNNKLCELFYTAKYINKKIFAHKNPFKYFGGIPNNIKNNLNKFTFYKNDSVSEIEINFDKNKNNNNININLIDNNKIEFRSDTHLICLSHDIFFKI